jgi:hypothetical protein
MDSIPKGAAAIREYCERQQFADFVIEGGLDYLVTTWEATVREVVDGYQAMDLEYLNDMDGRRIIREVWLLASDEQRRTYQDRLTEADRRFEEATNEVPQCLWGAKNEPKHGYSPEVDWYYYREPKVKGPNWQGEEMTPITLPLPHELVQRIDEEARRLDLSVEARISQILEGAVAPASNFAPGALEEGLSKSWSEKGQPG